jgi:prolyl-tRNA synthetase
VKGARGSWHVAVRLESELGAPSPNPHGTTTRYARSDLDHTRDTMADNKKLTTRAQDFSAWYNEVVLRAELADYSPVRGCMVIRPNGYGIWERMQRALDDMFKATGHKNAYFPLFIPESYLKKEAQHVEGFAPEVAVVTHGGGKKLEEPLIIRPTSETIIYSMFAKWVQSYRDLPLLINQWANVVRWEMRTRLFLRTLEFLWQEGHTAHATHDEAEEEARRMLGVYRDFMEGWMAMPVITGQKTDAERFAGALRTYACEAMMQDNKALQAGTSHNLGQNFAKAFDLKFQAESGEIEYAWNTSWGVSTRLIGGLVMTHGDDIGLRTPPLLAPIEVVVVPIWRSDEEKSQVLEAANRIVKSLNEWELREAYRLRVELDARDGVKPGAKYYEWELRGVPLRMELGPRDLAANQAVLVRRDTKEKKTVSLDSIGEEVDEILQQMQQDMLTVARERREKNSRRGRITYDEFKQLMDGEGAFVYAGWCGDAACEATIKDETKATIRVLPDEEFQSAEAPTNCLLCGRASRHEAIWAKAY